MLEIFFVFIEGPQQFNAEQYIRLKCSKHINMHLEDDIRMSFFSFSQVCGK